MIPAICIFDQAERSSSRNLAIHRWFEELGFRVINCRSSWPSPWRYFALVYQYYRIRRQVQGVWISGGEHALVPWIKFWTVFFGHRLIFDPFFSRYEYRQSEHNQNFIGRIQSWFAEWQDWSSCRFADHLVFDTHEHEAYFRRFKPRAPSTILEVSVDEDTFFDPIRIPTSLDFVEPKRKFEVLFYGSYTPIHGVRTLLQAAYLLGERTDLEFTLVGSGHDYNNMRSYARSLQLNHIQFIEQLSPSALANRIANADLCLGVFGTSKGAQLIVPKKVVQCSAMSKAIISCDSPAVRRYFRHESQIYLVPPGNSVALATAIEKLIKAPSARMKLGIAARNVFDNRFSSKVLKNRLHEILQSNAISHPADSPIPSENL